MFDYTANFCIKKLPSRWFDSVNFLLLRGEIPQFRRDSREFDTKFLSVKFLSVKFGCALHSTLHPAAGQMEPPCTAKFGTKKFHAKKLVGSKSLGIP